VKHGTLRLYLDGAKEIPHTQRASKSEDNQQGQPLYPDHAVIATVMYRKLDALSLRGEETYLCESPLSASQFHLRVYGESRVIITGRQSKVTAYGEAEFRLNVSDRIKITSIGQAKLRYMGNPDIVKGIHIGGVDMQKLD